MARDPKLELLLLEAIKKKLKKNVVKVPRRFDRVKCKWEYFDPDSFDWSLDVTKFLTINVGMDVGKAYLIGWYKILDKKVVISRIPIHGWVRFNTQPPSLLPVVILEAWQKGVHIETVHLTYPGYEGWYLVAIPCKLIRFQDDILSLYEAWEKNHCGRANKEISPPQKQQHQLKSQPSKPAEHESIETNKSIVLRRYNPTHIIPHPQFISQQGSVIANGILPQENKTHETNLKKGILAVLGIAILYSLLRK
ncbi:hypothetical protein [Thermococcus sp.]|uniref:hypothetical protein n=1 Tax=Thermococcus sp. TaxID=35749 RepID=UPI0025E649B5|nr:hypothetical protein [Thermococcus sp.]